MAEKPREKPIEMDDDNFFMSLAFLTSDRSKDPVTQVGACVVKDGILISTGYNGMPWGCSDDILPWDGTAKNEEENKRPYVCHAEYNAFVNRGDKDLSGCTLYTGLFPCKDCAKLIVQTGITTVVYMSDKHKEKKKYIIARDILEKANVEVREFVPTYSKLTLKSSATQNPFTALQK